MSKLIKGTIKNHKGGVLPDSKPVAIIDIGSNSVRLVVFEGAKLTPIPLYNEKCLCGLGRELATTGRLGADAVERALMALRRFRCVIDQIGASRLCVIATAAAREAENGPEFIKAATKICKHSIEVISGVREAELAAAGVLAGDRDADGFAGDMGGGSLELIDIRDRELFHGVTLPLGGLRLMDLAKNDLKAAKSIIDEALETVDWLEVGRDRAFYLVGGTWRAFIKLFMAEKDYPLQVLHGFKMSPEDVSDFAGFLIKSETLDDMKGMSNVSKQRRPVVPFGALVLSRLIKAIKPSEVVTPNFGVREGLLSSMLDEKELARDQLLAACEDLAYLRSRSPDHAFELCSWTDQLMKAVGIDEEGQQRRLRHAACLISDIGWRTHPSFRAERTMASIAYSVFSGIDHSERAFLAMTAFFRHNGPGSNPEEESLSSLLSKDELERARLIGAAIRTAHIISAGVTGIIPKTPVVFEEGRLMIELPHPFDALDGERLDRRFRGLGKILDMETEIRVNPDSRFFKFPSVQSLSI